MSHDNDNPNDPDIHDIYQSTRSDEPGAALDAAILAEAKAAVEIKRKRPAWVAPVGLAATVLLGVNLTVNLKDYSGDPAIFSETERPMVQSMNDDGADELADSAQEPQGNSALRRLSLPSVIQVEETRPESAETVDAASKPVAAPLPQSVLPYDALSHQDSSATAATTGAEVRAESLLALEYFESSPGRANQQEAEQKAKRVTETIAAAVARKEQAAATVEAQERKRESERQVSHRDPNPTASLKLPTAETDRSAPPVIVLVTPEEAVKVAGDATSTLALERPTGRGASAFPEQTALTEGPESGVSGIEEIVVSGSKIEDIDESPHRRLTARDQVARNAGQLNITTFSDSGDADVSEPQANALAKPAERAPVYVCDLSALRIDTDAIESAKVDARMVEPPLNALTWPSYIRELANEGDYVSACTHLAAYQRLFPGVAMIELLPVTIPRKN